MPTSNQALDDLPMESEVARAVSVRDGLLWGGGLLLMVLAIYLPAYRAGFIWDDDDYVYNNGTLTADGGLARIWTDPKASPQYYPLVFTSFWVESRLWGMNPAGYHLTNVVLHGLGAAVLWLVLVRLGVPGAWLGAALFAVHPVQVESVAWVAERKNVLSGLFYWMALWSYLRFAGMGTKDVGSWGWYAAALGLFACALLSKTVTCMLPAVLVLLLWWKRGRLTLRDGVALAPMFVLGIGFGLSTAFLEVTHVGAAGSEYDLRGMDRVLLAGRSLWFYLGKLVWPVGLIFIYPRWTIDASEGWQYLYPAVAVALAVLLALVRRWLGWGPLVAYLCFAGTLFPALGFFDVYPFRFSFVADHFQYLACAAPLALAAALATLAMRRTRPALAQSLAAVVIVILGSLSLAQTRAYRDVATLFQDTVAKNPACWMAHNNLGNLSLKKMRYREAEQHFRDCLDYKPDHLRASRGLVQALIGQRRVADASAELMRTRHVLADLRREPLSDLTQKMVSQEYLDVGALYELMNADADAEEVYRLALEVKPGWATAHLRLGNVLGKQSKFPEAIPHLRLVTEAMSDNADVCFALAQAQHAAGQEKGAIASAVRALRLAEASGNDSLAHLIRRRFAAQLSASK